MESSKATILASQLSDFVNTFSSRERSQEFIKAFSNEHRTLQQSAFRLMLELIQHMATSDYKTDGRNEQSKEIAKKLIKGFELAYHEELKQSGMSENRVKEYVGEHYLPSKFLNHI